MKRNPLDELSEIKQKTIFSIAEVLDEREVLSRLLKAPPQGFGVHVSRSGLRGWVQRKRRERMLEEARERLEEAQKFADGPGEGTKLEDGMVRLLQQRMFEEATGNLRPSELQAMYRLAKQEAWKKEQVELARRKMEATEEQVRLAKQRLQLNAVKLALAHAEELRGLISAGEVQDEEKLQGALARLFGEKFAKAVAAKELTEGNKGNKEESNHQCASGHE